MSVVNIKITDLDKSSPANIAEDDKFLKSSPISTASNSNNQQYENRITDLSSISECLLRKERTITTKWNFVTRTKPPIQVTRFDPRNFFNNFIIDKTKCEAVINLNSDAYDSSSFFPTSSSNNPINAKTAAQGTIANLDYTNRLCAACQKELLALFSTLTTTFIHTSGGTSRYFLPSFVGMLVYGTTSDLSSADKLKSIYGNGGTITIDETNNVKINIPKTSWIRHNKKYIFRASGSGITKNHAVADDGSNNTNISIPILLHTHIVGSHGHGVSSSKAGGSVTVVTGEAGHINGDNGSGLAFHGRSHPGNATAGASANCSGSSPYGFSKGKFYTNKTGSSTTINKIEATKYVYIWERIS